VGLLKVIDTEGIVGLFFFFFFGMEDRGVYGQNLEVLMCVISGLVNFQV
jgi:hypothetical protein